MAVILLRKFTVTLRDGETIDIYSEKNLMELDSTLHYCVSIEETGYVGLGQDGILLYDGVEKPSVRIKAREACSVPKERVTAGMRLSETDAILAAHKRAKKA